MQHLLLSPWLEQVCTAENLAACNDTAQKNQQFIKNHFYCTFSLLSVSILVLIEKIRIYRWQQQQILNQNGSAHRPMIFNPRNIAEIEELVW